MTCGATSRSRRCAATRRSRSPDDAGLDPGVGRALGRRGRHVRAGGTAHGLASALSQDTEHTWNASVVEPRLAAGARTRRQSRRVGSRLRLIARRRSSASPGGTSPYGRGHAPVAAEAEALLGDLEDAEATAFASGMTRVDVHLPDAARDRARCSRCRRAATTASRASRKESSKRFGVEVRRYDARDARRLAARSARERRSPSSRRPPIRS